MQDFARVYLSGDVFSGKFRGISGQRDDGEIQRDARRASLQPATASSRFNALSPPSTFPIIMVLNSPQPPVHRFFPILFQILVGFGEVIIPEKGIAGERGGVDGFENEVFGSVDQ